MSTTVKDYSVDLQTTDSAFDQKETEYNNDKWTTQFGYYKKIPELKSAIDAKARWTVGKGYATNPITEIVLLGIKGWGKDTFNTILENMIRTAHIGGDSYAEIIRNEQGYLINVKALSPEYMFIIANKKGLIKRYEYRHMGKTIKFEPDKILHFSMNRVADEIHGVSDIDAVEEIILARNEAMEDERQLMHRYVKPMRVFKLDTDDETEINTFKAKVDKATEKGENLFIPADAVDHELVAVPTSATLDPKAWIDRLTQYFYQAIGVPAVIVGSSQELTEATAKIVYLAFEQTVSEDQLYVMEQILAQLNLEIELKPPVSLKNELLNSERKAETTQAATPEDTTAGGFR